MTNYLSTENEWAQSGTSFYTTNRANKTKRLPPGIYRFVQPEREPWFLSRIANEFEFPFKVYNASQDVINRIVTHWENTTGNLGILMNGLRGAGKTMTAQLLANELLRRYDLPVLVVRNPIPLQIVFDAIQQDLIVIFDEFEKTHNEELHPGAQQNLLSTIDGMSRTSFRRMTIFTTNNIRVNENFQDRPGRIHYKFEFERVADEIIEGLIDDSLPAHLMHLKPEIFEFLNSRSICTIDIVKAVIAEVKIFEESPRNFEEMLNVAKGEPPSFTISLVDPETNVEVKPITRYFRPDSYYERWTQLLMGNKRSVENFTNSHQEAEVWGRNWEGNFMVTLLQKCEESNMWLAKLRVPREKTAWKEFDFLEDACLLLDNRPSDWGLPCSPSQAKRDAESRKEIEELYERSIDEDTVYATGNPEIFKISIVANSRSSNYSPNRYRATGAFH